MGIFYSHPFGAALHVLPLWHAIRSLGFDTVWFGILFTMNMEMAFLTPPFGVNLFYLRGVAPPGVSLGDIYRSVIFFVLLQALGLAIVMAFPMIALWLPNLLFGAAVSF